MGQLVRRTDCFWWAAPSIDPTTRCYRLSSQNPTLGLPRSALFQEVGQSRIECPALLEGCS